MSKDLERIKKLLEEAEENARRSNVEEEAWRKRSALRASLRGLSVAVEKIAEEVYEEEEPTPSITPLEEFLNNHDLSVSCGYSRHTGKWYASLDNAELAAEGREFLKSSVEGFNSIDRAMFHLAKRLRGEELKVKGEYVRVPKNLIYQYDE